MKNKVLEFFRYRFNLDEDKAEEEQIVASLRRNVEFRGTNLWALIFAILIASIGLNVNSTAVIIGAMLISPIMGPTMGIGLGLGIFDTALIRYSLKNLAIAVVISLVTSTVYFLLSPLSEAQSELLARTRPTIWDVLIALSGGLAGVIASTRRDISNTVPGVAIATALMPPLCTAGYGLANGNMIYFAGAFYLFVINCVFISIATFLIIRFLEFRQVRQPDPAKEKKIRRVIWTVAALTIIPSLYLAFIFVSEGIFEQKARRFINTELRSRNLFVADKFFEPMKKRLTLTVYGAELTDTLVARLSSGKAMYGLKDVDLVLEKVQEDAISVRELSAFRSDVQQQLFGFASARMDQEKRLKALERTVTSQIAIDNNILRKEFEAVFGQVKEFGLVNAPLVSALGSDTVSILYVVPLKRRPDAGKVKSWLQARLQEEEVRVVFDR